MRRMIFLFLLLALLALAGGQIRARVGQTSGGAAGTATNSAGISPGNGIQIRIFCGSTTSRLKSISDGLKLVGNVVPTTLLISGTCHEGVQIVGLTNVTLQGNPTATIDGGSDPTIGTVEISGSQNIALTNLTITGGGEGVGCQGHSFCALTGVTIQNSLGDGASVSDGARLDIVDSVIQNNADVGLSVGAGSAAFLGGEISGNASDGVAMRNGGTLVTGGGNAIPNVTIQNNAGTGVRTIVHNTLVLNTTVVKGNGGDGVTLQTGSAMNMLSSTVSNNSGHQVRIGDLSVARFTGFASNTVTGTNYPDVVCDPQFSATSHFSSLIGTTTNCAPETAPLP